MPSRLLDDVWFVACLVGLGVLVAVDLGSSRDINLTGTMCFAPFMASAVCSPVRTVLVSVLSATAGYALLAHDMAPSGVSIARGTVLGAAVLLAPVVSISRRRQQRQMQELRHVAEVAQLAVLTPVPPLVGPVALSTAYRSASREALIGGDLYAVVECGNAVRILVGDVRGKGLDAVQLAALVLSVFREAALAHDSLTDLALAIDQRLAPYLKQEDFVTAVFADVDPQGQVEIVSCGHPAPILVDPAGRRLLDSADPAAPLGLGPEPTGTRYLLKPGDRILFYTDGLIEARSRDGGFVDLDRVLEGVTTDPTDVALDRLLHRLYDVAGEVRDDLALLLAEYVGTGPGQRNSAST